MSLVIISCKKDDDSDEIVIPSPVTVTTIAGRVVMTNQLPAAFVKVTCNSITTTTDAKGFYLFRNITVPANRCVVSLENGFFKSLKARAGIINYCDMTVPEFNKHTFNSMTGGTVTDPSGVTIAFESMAIQKSDGTLYNGIVNVSVFYMDPTEEKNSGINPVHDSQVIINNIIKFAYSLGSVVVELTSPAGTRLNLIPSKPAILTIPIADTRITSPQTVYLVSGDATSGNWKPEGTAQKSGNNYVSMVTHFSWWNAVFPLGTALVTGQVKDIAGHPIPNAVVRENWTYELARTDQNGLYQFYVPDGLSHEVACSYYYNMGESAGPILTPALSNGQIYTAPDLVFQNATIITGNSTDCNNNSLFSFVTITDSDEYYNYSLSGSTFSLFAGASKQVTLFSSQFNQYNLTSLTAGVAGSLTSAGTIQVCSTAPSSGNMTLTFTSPVTGTQTGTLNMEPAIVYTDSSNTWSYISLYSMDSINLFGFSNYYIEMWIPVQNSFINSNMPWSHVYSVLWAPPLVMYGESYNTVYHGFDAYGSNGTTTAGSTNITFLGPVGALITGSFTGPIEIYDTTTYDLILTGNISGSFSVTRSM